MVNQLQQQHHLGPARQLPVRSRPTPRPATSASAGPATSTSSPPPPRSTWTRLASSPSGCRTCATRSRANGAYPDVAPRACCGDGRGRLGRRRHHRPVHALAALRRHRRRRGALRVDGALRRLRCRTPAPATGDRRRQPYRDWLNLDDDTAADVIGTAYFAHSTRLLARDGRRHRRGRRRRRLRARCPTQIADGVRRRRTSRPTARSQGDSQTGVRPGPRHGPASPTALRAKARPTGSSPSVERRDWHLSDRLPRHAGPAAGAQPTPGTWTSPTGCCINDGLPVWGYEIATAPPRSGSAGTPSGRTAASATWA